MTYCSFWYSFLQKAIAHYRVVGHLYIWAIWLGSFKQAQEPGMVDLCEVVIGTKSFTHRSKGKQAQKTYNWKKKFITFIIIPEICQWCTTNNHKRNESEFNDRIVLILSRRSEVCQNVFSAFWSIS